MSEGSGASKKDAKKAAAIALLEKLKALGNEVAAAAGAAANNGANATLDDNLVSQIDVLVSAPILI